ncbi:type II secretion system minor pseudopilin GspH [Thermithiobacillus plumbiphilus]|uniref:Type II secretion system protein H n=1 Tax=Thermithiobacillus plumbiphilus TaxID=1729899 RepID=A0ABU9D9I0_9PROT
MYRQRGFTLIEILVVLVLIGITLGLVGINLMPDQRRELGEEAQRLALLIEQAQEEAVLSGNTLGFELSANGYRFVRENAAVSDVPGDTDKPAWSVVEDDELLRPRQWRAAIAVEALSINGQPVPLPMKSPLLLSPTGLGEPFELDLALEGYRIQLAGDGRRVRVVSATAPG